jgi:hypothetical protein
VQPDHEDRTVELAKAMMRALDALERLSDAVTIVSSAMADGDEADLENARHALATLASARAEADAALADAQDRADAEVDRLASRGRLENRPVTGVVSLVTQKITREG